MASCAKCSCGADSGATRGSTTASLFKQYAPSPPPTTSKHKITVVGCGAVGMASVFSLLTQGVSADVAIVDVMEDKLKGELLDLQHGGLFLKGARIQASTDYSVSKGSAICVVTAGARQAPGESRLNLLQKNVKIMQGIIPNLVKHSPDTLILLVSNPVDIMTYIAWKLSGLPKHRVIGSGTNLDSARFRVMLAERLGVSPVSTHAWIIGEHGDSSIPIWSGVNIAGVRLNTHIPKLGSPDDPEKWSEVHKEVVDAAYKIINLKGYTSWAIGLSVAQLCTSILNNTYNVHAVSVSAKGHYGINEDVFLSLPAILTLSGVSSIVTQDLSPSEIESLKKSVKIISEQQSQLSL